MKRTTTWICGLTLLLAGSVSAQYVHSVYSELNDAMIEDRVGEPVPKFTPDNGSNPISAAGDWYDGLACTVLPFQLPDVGAVSDPYDSASFSAYLEYNGVLNPVDLYYVRTSTNSDIIATNDYYTGTDDTTATLLQTGFIAPATIAGTNVNSDVSANTNLVAMLNAAYDNGAGAGDYVFLRLSYTFDSLPAAGGESSSAKINSRNNDNGATWPTISIVSTVDLDNDTLPDIWEIANGLSPNDDGSTIVNNGPNGNPDFPDDDLINSDELLYGTDPQVGDTDDDGLSDSYEVVANPYITDPLDSDSDDDLLSDGEEVGTWGTKPLDPDSDSDGANDATEVYANSDPNSGSSAPANERPDVVGIEIFVDYVEGVYSNQVGGELFDYDNNVSNDTYTGHTGAQSTWSVDSGSPSISAGALLTQESGLLRALNGEGTGGKEIALFAQAFVSPEVDSEALYVKVEMTREAGADWSGLSCYATGSEEIFFGVDDDGSGSNNVFKIREVEIDGNEFSSITPTNNNTYTMVVSMDASTEEVALWIDPDLGSPEPAPDVIRSGVLPENLRCDSIRLASGGSGNVQWDNLVIGKTWDSLSTSASDTDGDGMPDTWEITYGLDPLDDGTTNVVNGASGNADTDLLTNIEEFDNNTNPTVDDTDIDGLDDDVEVNSTGTNPTKADTDGDNLKDGAELAADPYVTDPLLADTDDDTYNDDVEIAYGSDPTVKADNPGANGDVLVDGTLDRIVYGDPIVVQTVQTQFGDNQSELNAAYAYVKNGRLYLMLTGNIEANWNKLEIFIDSADSGTSNVLNAVGNDGSDVMDGLTFDEGFTPDYHLHFRRDGGNAYFDIADLAAQTSSGYGSLFAGEGSAITGTGSVNAVEMEVSYDNSNTAGVLGGTEAADQAAATNVTTGFELSVALSDLGNPSGTILVSAMVNSGGRNYLSNQMLGGLAAPQGNLGGDGVGGGASTLALIDLGNYGGDQFFPVTIPIPDGPFDITDIQLITGNTQVQLIMNGLAIGQDYVVQDSVDLTAGFTDVSGSQFTASNDTANVVVLSADIDTEPVRFFQARDTL